MLAQKLRYKITSQSPEHRHPTHQWQQAEGRHPSY